MIKHEAHFTRDDDRVIVKCPSNCFGKAIIHTIACSSIQYKQGIQDYNKGASVQNAFNFLSSADREFLISGLTTEQWDAVFMDDEEAGD